MGSYFGSLEFLVCSATIGFALGYFDTTNMYDISKKCGSEAMCYNFSDLEEYLNREEVKRELGVGDRVWLVENSEIEDKMRDDMVLDTTPELEVILESGKEVLLYFGERDFICNWKGGKKIAEDLKWKGRERFREQKLEETKFGLSKRFANLEFLKFADAGHFVPMDAPEKAFEMFAEFIRRT